MCGNVDNEIADVRTSYFWASLLKTIESYHKLELICDQLIIMHHCLVQYFLR